MQQRSELRQIAGQQRSRHRGCQLLDAVQAARDLAIRAHSGTLRPEHVGGVACPARRYQEEMILKRLGAPFVGMGSGVTITSSHEKVIVLSPPSADALILTADGRPSRSISISQAISAAMRGVSGRETWEATADTRATVMRSRRTETTAWRHIRPRRHANAAGKSSCSANQESTASAMTAAPDHDLVAETAPRQQPAQSRGIRR